MLGLTTAQIQVSGPLERWAGPEQTGERAASGPQTAHRSRLGEEKGWGSHLLSFLCLHSPGCPGEPQGMAAAQCWELALGHHPLPSCRRMRRLANTAPAW